MSRPICLKIGFLALSILLLSPTAHSSLELQEGSYANRTHIDPTLRRANLNFIYNGCDPNPDPSRIRINTDGNCNQARNYQLGRDQGNTSISGTVGELVASYDEPNGTECAQRTTRRLHANISLQQAYEMFQRRQCFPTYILLRDSTRDDAGIIVTRRNESRICSIPDTRVTKAGFPTEDFAFFNMFANDSGFRIGEHTHYRFDHAQNHWCVKHRENDERCGQWPSPLPMAYQDASGRIHVRGTVSLGANGQASIRGINKTYNSMQQMHTDQRNGGLTQTDTSLGRIDFRTWRRESSGVVRSVVRSFETDTPQGAHQRTMNFMARNVMGAGITHSWCPDEHCFAGVSGETLQASRCQLDPSVAIDRGGNGNTCHSCIGITPGLCAVERSDVDSVRTRLLQDNDFRMLDTGEYQFNQNIERGLERNFERIVSTPRNPGCHAGYAPDFNQIFDPGAGTRSVNTVEDDKNKKKQEKKK
jgi:hypothetical protein